jgi:hypothetical protein
LRPRYCIIALLYRKESCPVFQDHADELCIFSAVVCTLHHIFFILVSASEAKL